MTTQKPHDDTCLTVSPQLAPSLVAGTDTLVFADEEVTTQKALGGRQQVSGEGGRCSLDDPLLRVEGGQRVQAQPAHHLEGEAGDEEPCSPPAPRQATAPWGPT